LELPGKPTTGLLDSQGARRRDEWVPNRAIDYFRGRDSEALQFLPKLIAANKPKKLN
jgi:hypothetical protein